MNAIVIQHEEREEPGMLGPALRSAGFRIHLRFREVVSADADADLVAVMGGSMGAHEIDKFPFLGREIALLQERLGSDRSCLGICLGAQLLASAAGARVYPGSAGFELGIHGVRLTPAALAEPAFRSLPSPWIVAHWHGDTFDPVPGAVGLAFTEQYEQQAFRIGHSFGLQFHPELDAETFVRWVKEVPEDLARSGKTEADLIRNEVPALREAEKTNAEFLENLLRQMSKRSAAHP